MAEAEIRICARPGCDQPGPSLCGSCGEKGYCGRTCQVEDWPRHKEADCQGHLRKIGMNNIEKAEIFDEANNWLQSLRYSDLALEKLKKLNDRPIEEIDNALLYKFKALNFMDRKREAMDSAKERYCLYLTSHTHPPAINASFALIESCIHNKEYEDAEVYARTTWETITLSRDSHIPDNRRQYFTAQGAYFLALAMLNSAEHGGVPLEANQTAGREAIALARRSFEIWTQMHQHVATSMDLLARALDYFINVDDDEVLRLYEQSIAIHARVEGSSSLNVGVGKNNLACTYHNRAKRAFAANDVDRVLANLDFALPLYVEAARILRAVGHVDKAEEAAEAIVQVEEKLQQIRRAIAAATRG